MDDAHNAKRDRIRNMLIAATGLGLSVAAQQAAAQAPRPTASPPVVTAPAQPTTAPPTVVSSPATAPAPSPRPAASKAR